MHTLLLLDMAASGHGDRIAATDGADTLTFEQLHRSAWAAAAVLADARHLVYVGTNGLAYPIGLFGAAAAGIPFVPLNYRLGDEQLDTMLGHHEGAMVVADEGIDERLRGLGHEVTTREDFVRAALPGADPGEAMLDGDEVALLLYTSGTTSAPKAAVLRHRNLASYVIGSVEFGAADDSDAVLVCVPPYHIAGVANLLSNTYLGRRIVYLDRFDPDLWLGTVRREQITHAMVVPTMLARITDALADQNDAATPTLRSLSYGGSRTPATVLERIMELFPDTDLTNAYGLTETSSTIAVLGPDDHRAAATSDDPAVRARLASAGRLLPAVEVEVRENGRRVDVGEVGDIWVRGEQVSGEYEGMPLSVDAEGWFPTRDRGWLDADGYLFIEGRSDDTIIRGGENIAPAEIEEVLLGHPDVSRCAVVGLPDDEWGQRIAAVVVLRDGALADADAITSFARSQLRGSKTPDVVSFATDLPYTDTGKLLRRQVLADLMADQPEKPRT
jgi:acyl-CoA synthetase (AMP-forming)/AMP-acid ligase II